VNRSTANPTCQRTRLCLQVGSSLLANLLLFTPFFVLAVFAVVQACRFAVVHNDTTYPEGASVYAFLYAIRTGHLYASPFQYPWNVQLYGPLFYLTGTCIAWLVHGDPFATTVVVRLLAFAALIGSATLLALMTWKLEHSRRWSTLVFLMGLGCSWAALASVSARPDTLAIFFFLAGLAVYLAADDRLGTACVCGALCSISALFKQNTAPFLLMLLLDPLIRRKPTQAFAMLAGALPVPMIFFLALWLRHEPIAANFFAISHSRVVLMRIGSIFADALRHDEIAAMLLALAILGMAVSRSGPGYASLARITLAAWVFTLVSLANAGSSFNYLVPAYLLSLVFVPPAFMWLSHRSRLLQGAPMLLGVMGIAVLIRHARTEIPTSPLELEAGPVRNLDLLSDMPFLEAQSRDPQFLDPLYYRLLFMNRNFSSAAFDEDIARDAFDLVLIQGSNAAADATSAAPMFDAASWWGNQTLHEVRSRYRVLCEVSIDQDSVMALVPQNRQSSVNSSTVSEIFRAPCNATNRAWDPTPGP